VHVQPHDVDSRVEHLDESVALLTSEVASLKLELAAITGALRDSQINQPSALALRPIRPFTASPSSRPSATPAAIVVLLATALLSWQLIKGPQSDQGGANATTNADALRVAHVGPVLPPAGTEPPVAPVVRPTVYKGTLAIAADRPGARVYLNRREIGVAPVRVPNLKAGSHLVWIESDGFRRWTRVVTVPAERVTRVAADLEPLEPVVEYK